MERLLDYIKNNVCWEMGAISTEMWEEGSIPMNFAVVKRELKRDYRMSPYPS
jgi:hypothetical protein